jgi:putative drug exporter of the RND superfamily
LILDSLLAAVTGPRGRWVAIVLWTVAAAGCVFLHSRLGDVTAAGQSSFLPASSDSTQALGQLGSRFGSGDNIPALVVFARTGGLTAHDRAVIARVRRRIDADKLAGATPAINPLAQREARSFLGEAGFVARGNRAAVLVLGIDADVRNAVTGDVERIRALIEAETPPGLAAHLTGPAGIATDFEQVADEAGRTLLFATLGLVLVLLLAVYRSPALAVLPLAVVGAAYMLAAGLAYFLIEADLIEVNTEGTMLLLVLIFGAGTDYALLMVHRYRSELAGGARRETLCGGRCRPARRRSSPRDAP